MSKRIVRGEILRKHQIDLIKKLLDKPKVSKEDQKNFEIVSRFNEGKSKSEVYQVKCFFAEFSGNYILKVSPKNAWGEEEEETRFQNLVGKAPDFARNYFVQFKCAYNIEEYIFTFWVSTFDTSIGYTFELNKEQNFNQTVSALGYSAAKLLELFENTKSSANKVSLKEVCENILDYRTDPVDGKIWSFVRENLKLGYKSPSFIWNNKRLSNPYYYALNANEIIIDFAFKSASHGDCHTGNIFTSFSNNIAVDLKFIDFALSRRNVFSFYDLAYLEISLAINHEICSSEDSNRWDQFFSSLTAQLSDNDIPPAQDIDLKLKYDAIFKEIKSYFIKSQSTDLRKLYYFQRICAGLNFCNKDISTTQKKFAFLYAAHHLEAFIQRFKSDDSEIAHLKDNLYLNPDFLYEEELKNLQVFESTWLELERNIPDHMNREPGHLISIYEKIKPLEIYNRKPSYLSLSPSRVFSGFYFNHCKSSSMREEAILFGFLALALNCTQLNLSAFYDASEFQQLMTRFNAISFKSLSRSEKHAWIEFYLLLIKECLILQNEEDFFKLLKEAPLEDFSIDQINQIKYYECLFYASTYSFKKLEIHLLSWTPEVWRRDLPNSKIHWLVKKANLLLLLKDSGLGDSIEELFKQGYLVLETEPYSEQLNFLDAYTYFLFSKDWTLNPLYTELTIKSKIIESKHYIFDNKHYKFQTFKKLIETIIKIDIIKESKKLEPYEKNRYKIQGAVQYFGPPPEIFKRLYSVRVLHLLIQNGLLLKISNTNLFDAYKWYPCFIQGFRYYPELYCYYSYHYTGSDLEENFFRRIAQDLIYDEILTEKVEKISTQLQKLLMFYFSHKGVFRHELMLFISETLIVRDPENWRNFFEFCWCIFANQRALFTVDYHLVRYIKPFFEKGLELTNNLKILREVINDCLAFNEGEGWQVDYLSYLVDNKTFKDNIDAFKDERLDQAIKTLIEKLNDDVDSISRLLHNSYLLLSNEHSTLIANKLSKDFHMPTYKSSYLTYLRISKGNKEVQKKIKDSLLAQESWINGIKLSETSYKRNVLLDAIPPFHKLRKSKQNPYGLVWSKKELSRLFQELKHSYKVIKEYERKNQIGGKIEDDILHEMLLFLRDNEAQLKGEDDFDEVKLSLQDRSKLNISDSKLAEDLLSNSDSAVAQAISRFQELLANENYDLFNELWMTLLSKVSTRAEPKLEYSLEFLSVWLQELKDKDLLFSKDFFHFYDLICSLYLDADLSRTPFIQEWVFKIARVLQYRGLNSPSIEKWYEIKEQSRFKTLTLLSSKLNT